MSINIDLGAWNSIFAVPSKVVDEGLKFSDGVKLKVLFVMPVVPLTTQKFQRQQVSM